MKTIIEFTSAAPIFEHCSSDRPTLAKISVPSGAKRTARFVFRTTFGLALLSATVSHRALAQSMVSSDPATWRTPEYNADWGLEGMRAADAYAQGFTGRGITLGVVDSGFYSAHSEFADGRVKPVTLTGTYGSDGYFFQNFSGKPRDRSPQPSFFKAGQAFNISGDYNAAYNDSHGTHVTGTLAAARDGVEMHGVAFDANVYVSNTGSTDDAIYGPNVDYTYFKAAYGSLAAAGARAINSSWGSPPTLDNYDTVSGLLQSYQTFDSGKTWLDAIAEVSQQYSTIQLIAAGNTAYSNPNVRSSLPYFRPVIEKYWLAVVLLI